MSFPNSYTSFVTGLTGGQFVLPAAAYSWSVLVQSGTAFINGNPVFATTAVPIVGGRYGGFKMNGSSTIVVGCTGASVFINWDA